MIDNKIKDFFNDLKNNEQKKNNFLILFLIFIGVCSIFVGFSNSKKILKNSFVDKEQEAIDSIYATYDRLVAEGKIKEDIIEPQPEVVNPKTLSDTTSKNTDTDGDGISDYDESNIFKTSAFLFDSDGDGTSDYDEIKNGTDPNCPTGKDCSVNIQSEKNTDLVYNSLDIDKMDIAQARIELEKIIPTELKPMLLNMSDDQIRELMKQLYKGSVSSEDNSKNNVIIDSNNTSVDYKSILKSKLPQFTAAQISMMEEMEEVDLKKILLDSNIADESLLSKFKSGEVKETVLGR